MRLPKSVFVMLLRAQEEGRIELVAGCGGSDGNPGWMTIRVEPPDDTAPDDVG